MLAIIIERLKCIGILIALLSLINKINFINYVLLEEIWEI
jgi:hypothetical protein